MCEMREYEENSGSFGQSLMVLHGAVGSVGDWQDFALDLRAVDLWQYQVGGVCSLWEAADRIAQEEGECLLGYSMGGRLALHAVLRHPERWRALVIVSAHTGLSEDERVARLALDESWAARAEGMRWGAFVAAWNAQGVLGGNELGDRAELAGRSCEVARSFRGWSLGAQEDLLPRLSEIKIPVLWLVGERDDKFRVIGQRACAEIAQARYRVLADCGHRLPWQSREAFEAAVRGFLAELG